MTAKERMDQMSVDEKISLVLRAGFTWDQISKFSLSSLVLSLLQPAMHKQTELERAP